MTCLHNIIWGYKKHFLGRNIKKSAASHMQRYAFLLKDARNFGKMFEDEGDKQNKQGYHDIGESDAFSDEACLDGR